jgi:mannose-1-phosphate guanylyltransferase/mannose-6-phosphate isomerase
MLQDHLQEIDFKPSAILLEPIARGTAAAIAASIVWAELHTPEAILLILPADHYIEDEAAFANAVEMAAQATTSESIITFGIPATRADSNFGYVKIKRMQDASQTILDVEKFVEKPLLKQAKEFTDDQGWFWNSGIFCFSIAAGKKAFTNHAELMYRAAEKSLKHAAPQDHMLVLGSSFADAPKAAFDRAVLEHYHVINLLPLKTKWADLGTWEQVFQQSAKDEEGNATSGETMLQNTSNCFVRGGKKLISLVGLKDLIIVDTDDALLIADRGHATEIGHCAETLAQDEKPQAQRHLNEQRPWGHFQSIDQGEHFKVKRISVKPGGKLSLQCHKKRAEHWVVISGYARVTCGEQVFELSAHQSTYIPMNTLHRLENIGEDLLEIIEVQTGSVCDEADIIRIEDDYLRIPLNRQ